MNSNIVRHVTEVIKLSNGFEYICKTCGYHATYTISENGTRKMHVVFTGDNNNSKHALDFQEGIIHLESQVEAILQSYTQKYGEW